MPYFAASIPTGIMTIFPTQYSTLSSAALKDSIERNYGLLNLSCRYLLRGVSDTYILENAHTKYILKIYRSSHRSLEEIQGEIELLAHLKDRGAKVADALADVQGNSYQTYQAAEGTRHGVLFRHARGKSIMDLTEKHMAIVGHEMAFNHNITSSIKLSYERKPYSIDTTLTQPIAALEPAFREYPEGYTYLKNTAEQVASALQAMDTDHFNYGYCHYDYLPKNFHFDEHDTLTLFDFDFAGPGWLANDLASFTIYLYFYIAMKKKTIDEARQDFKILVDAYRKVRPITDEEINAIPLLGFMFWTFYLRFQYENFDDWSNTFFGPRFLRERIATIQHYAEIIPQLI
jgi:Ser/Thr protein kinase RdoA (MazF antagonist)